MTLVETDDDSLLGTGGAGAISLPMDTPNYTPGSLNISDPRSGQPYFNSALVFTRETLGTLGNSRRRFFSGPGLEQLGHRASERHNDQGRNEAEFRAELSMLSITRNLVTGRKRQRSLPLIRMGSSPDLGWSARESAANHAAFAEAALLVLLARHSCWLRARAERVAS